PTPVRRQPIRLIDQESPGIRGHPILSHDPTQLRYERRIERGRLRTAGPTPRHSPDLLSRADHTNSRSFDGATPPTNIARRGSAFPNARAGPGPAPRGSAPY